MRKRSVKKRKAKPIKYRLLSLMLALSLGIGSVSIPSTLLTTYAEETESESEESSGGLGGIISNLLQKLFEKIEERAEFISGGGKTYTIDSWYTSDGKTQSWGIFDIFKGLFSKEEDVPKSKEEAVQKMIDIIDEYVQKAYTYAGIEVMAQAADRALHGDFDVGRTVSSYYTLGNTVTNLDYAWILSVYTLLHPYEKTTLQTFKDDMDVFAHKMIKVSLNNATTRNITKVPVYQMEKRRILVCEDSEDEDGNTEHNTHYEDYYAYMYEDGKKVIKEWITDEDGRLEDNYVVQSVNVSTGGDSCHINSTDYFRIVNTSECEEYGKIRVFPTFDDVEYANVSLTQFNNDDLWEIWGMNPDDNAYDRLSDLLGKKHEDHSKLEFGQFTNRDLALFRANQFRKDYPNLVAMAGVRYNSGLTREQIENYLAMLPEGTSGNRKQVVKVALTLVGQVPYCDAGEDSKPKQTGYDPTWWDYTRCDSSGRPSGLDSAGFVQWAFWTAGFSQEEVANLKTTSLISNKLSEIIKEEDLKPGDIGLVKTGVTDENNSVYNNVGIYLGNNQWIVNSGAKGTVVVSSTESYNSKKIFSPRMEDDDLWTDDITLYGIGSANYGDGDFYTICQVILQECATSEQGTLAVAECIKNRALDTERFGAQDTVWKVITQKGQFESYSSGDYTTRNPTSSIMERIRQVFDGQYTVLNNVHVLDFTSVAWYKKHKQEDPQNYRFTQMVDFGEYGDNMYYIYPKYLNDTGNTGMSVYIGGSGGSAENCTVPANNSNHQAKLYLQGQGSWASTKYGYSSSGAAGTIASRGCGICATAMAINYCLYGGSGNYSPIDLLNEVGEKYSVTGSGSSHILPSVAAKMHGLQTEYNAGCPSASYEQTALAKFRSGWVAVCTVGKGYFTNGGHFIMLTGCDSNGNIYVCDSSSGERSTRGYSWAFLVSSATGPGADGNYANDPNSKGGTMTSITWIKSKFAE